MFPTDRLCGSGGGRENKISIELRDFVLLYKHCHTFNIRYSRVNSFYVQSIFRPIISSPMLRFEAVYIDNDPCVSKRYARFWSQPCCRVNQIFLVSSLVLPGNTVG